MSLIRTQSARPMEVSFPDPVGNKLMLLEMNGTESLGRLFSFELELMAEEVIKYADVLGRNVSIRLTMREGGSRFFNGDIARFTFLSVVEDIQQDKKLYYYRATMVPRLWFLTRHSDCRIFQNQTVPDIIKKIFSERCVADVKTQLSATYNPWVYCVQYRETDFNFISRLMEAEGIYYYFEHENGKHFVVLCDAPSAHKPAPNYSDLDFDEPDLNSTTDAFIWNWTLGTEITPNKYALTDYNHLQPRTDLAGNINVDHTHDPDTYEIFDYPGDYEAPDESRRYANTRLEEIEAQYMIAHGTSSARGLFAGCTFTLQKHPAYDPEEYLVTSIAYSMENDDIGGGRGSSGGNTFSLQVTCIPSKYEFRSQRVTPRPIVQGPQTAIVVGPSGEEIHTNEQGQVKVKFFWDRDPKKDETSSCWVRVSQAWAGLNWGMINLPRIGQEVIVDFLEGDPDKPIITGRVYNAVNTPPYPLPPNQTMTTFKSNSSKGGSGFNELRFEDKKGDEQIFIHGEKNLDIRIKNDRFENILRDRNLVVERDKFEHVKNKRHEIVDVDHLEEIKGDRSLKVDGKEAKEVDKSLSLKVKEQVTKEFNDSHSEVVTKDYYLQAENIVIEGKTSITIKVGKNSIAIDSSGIEIDCQEPMSNFDLKTKGNTTLATDMNTKMESKINFDIKGTAGASLEGTGQVAIKTTGMGKVSATGMLQVTSSALLQIQGSIVMIN